MRLSESMTPRARKIVRILQLGVVSKLQSYSGKFFRMQFQSDCFPTVRTGSKGTLPAPIRIPIRTRVRERSPS